MSPLRGLRAFFCFFYNHDIPTGSGRNAKSCACTIVMSYAPVPLQNRVPLQVFSW
ncbi:MAG: hypothetical protein JETT_3245 [Candidatus Jettenia ecosi]|uniref:Uncharacterized protein n=1 Tax=Candidatus Jettenia ecosi TaxID=2494326 RepID=A0A533Q786_9BACT|nr:MAG: hypothetical protein JETT_3245 [Candidatus Jettenia ecosi]